MTQTSPSKPVNFAAVRAAESKYVQQRRELAAASGTLPLYDPLDRRPIGLALSGGGVRSATFGLGVLQALSMLRLLPKIDYMSTVSGGGYIGSCLTSLLSHRGEPDGSIAMDEAVHPYCIDPRRAQQPHFGTTPDSFPFNPERTEQLGLAGFNGIDQLRHLRTRGDFIMVRNALLSTEVRRAVGHVLGGLFWHVLVFTLFMVAVSAFYLGTIAWWMGLDQLPHAIRGLTLSQYVWRLIDWPASGSFLHYPLFWAILFGAFCTLLAAQFLPAALNKLDDRRFRTEGRSVADQRETVALWILFWVTLVAALAVTIYFVLQNEDPSFGNLALPLGFYIGGQITAIILHACVSISPRWNRNARSRFAAHKGTLNYLSAVSVALVFLPYFIFWLDAHVSGLWVSSGAAVSALGAWLLAQSGSKAAGAVAGSIRSNLLRLLTWARKALLALCILVLLVGAVALIDVGLLHLHVARGGSLLTLALGICSVSLILFLVLGMLLNFNKLALHYFYRDRLVETYLQTSSPVGGPSDPRIEVVKRDDAEMKLTDIHGSVAQGQRTGERTCSTTAPYHLIVTSLNLTASRDMTRRDRKSDQFIFSKLYCGSETTGYLPTSAYRDGQTKLAHAMSISGAAASSAMGRGTFFAEAFAFTLFNVRLGQWMENPRYKDGKHARRNERGVFWPYYLVREMLGSTDARDRLINLSDGGHSGDNIGITPLLRRRCAIIIAVDAEADPQYTFGSTCEALRQTYIDENIKVDLTVDDIRPESETASSRRHHAIARIRYPETETLPAELGWLIVLKPSLTGDELARLADYRRANPEFPQQSTADQFFDDDQFESYRELGYHIAKMSLRDLPPDAWACDNSPLWLQTWALLAPPDSSKTNLPAEVTWYVRYDVSP
jgi:Patatin-like phospholipase